MPCNSTRENRGVLPLEVFAYAAFSSGAAVKHDYAITRLPVRVVNLKTRDRQKKPFRLVRNPTAVANAKE